MQRVLAVVPHDGGDPARPIISEPFQFHRPIQSDHEVSGKPLRLYDLYMESPLGDKQDDTVLVHHVAFPNPETTVPASFSFAFFKAQMP